MHRHAKTLQYGLARINMYRVRILEYCALAAWYHGYRPPCVGRVLSIDASAVWLEANHGKPDKN